MWRSRSAENEDDARPEFGRETGGEKYSRGSHRERTPVSGELGSGEVESKDEVARIEKLADLSLASL